MGLQSPPRPLGGAGCPWERSASRASRTSRSSRTSRTSRGFPGSCGSAPSQLLPRALDSLQMLSSRPESSGSLERAECGPAQVSLLSGMLGGSSTAETILFQVKKESLSRHKCQLEYHEQRCSYMAITEIYHNVDTYALFFSKFFFSIFFMYIIGIAP